MTKGAGSTISNCINNGDARSEKQNVIDDGKPTIRSDYAGGIIALIQHTTTIKNCKNTGNISGYNYHVGGIVGGAADNTAGKATFKVEIKKCVNTGNITSSEIVEDGHNAGAIIGLCGTASAVSIDNCTNEKGAITGGTAYDNGSLVGLAGNDSTVVIK